ncbi:vesicle-mediated transport, partial [Coemansia sp. RSA 2599]
MSGKKQATESRPQSQFFAAPEAQQTRRLAPLASPTKDTLHEGGVGVRDVLRNKLKERMRAREEAKARGDDEWDESQFVQLDRETSEHVKSLIEQSDAIKRVRKERIFEDEVTEEEMTIIQQRVALQQKQFAEFERREFAHKARRIRQ